jgi:zinc/manganese transport system ATP-binding protein
MSPPSREGDEPALVFDRAGVTRRSAVIWSQSTFTVPRGGVAAVIGPNGAGKTTLLQAILGLVDLSAGTVRVFGKRPGHDNESVGYVPQRYASISDDAIRVVDAVTLGLNGARWGCRRGSTGDASRVEKAMHAVNVGGIAGRRLSQLSGGQRQRVAIAAAVVAQPKLLILDEPLASVDIGTQREIVGLLGGLHHELGVTILVAAHDLNPLLGLLSGAIYLMDGRAHYDTIDSVVRDDLLTRLYRTPVTVTHTAQGRAHLSSAL